MDKTTILISLRFAGREFIDDDGIHRPEVAAAQVLDKLVTRLGTGEALSSLHMEELHSDAGTKVGIIYVDKR